MLIPSATRGLILMLPMLLTAGSLESSAATFSGIGDLPGGSFYSIATGLSADGSTVVGRSSSASGSEAFRRRTGSAIEGLGDLPGGAFLSEARAASADGSVVVGWSADNATPTYGAFRWTDTSAMLALPDFWPGSAYWHSAEDVTADGAIVAGWNYIDVPMGIVAFTGWLIQGSQLLWQLEALDVTPWGSVLSPAVYAISADGSVWGGSVLIGETAIEAVVWTNGGTDLSFITEGSDSVLHGMSADGSTAVGSIDNEAYAWTAAGGVVRLGDLPGGSFSSNALDASADGAVVVGYGTTDLGQQAFVWDADNGMRNVVEVLACHGAAEVRGWTKLTRAVAISDDALTIAGWGTNPDGNTEAWTATVPRLGEPCEPAVLPVASGGGVVVLIAVIVGLGAWAARP